MNRTAIARRVAEAAGENYGKTLELLKLYEELILEAIKQGEEVALAGFGTFKRFQAKAREFALAPGRITTPRPSMKFHVSSAVRGKLSAS